MIPSDDELRAIGYAVMGITPERARLIARQEDANAMDTATRDALESIVDTHGMGAVLGALVAIAYTKADHAEADWQDSRLARVWERIGRKLERVEVAISPIDPLRR